MHRLPLLRVLLIHVALILLHHPVPLLRRGHGLGDEAQVGHAPVSYTHLTLPTIYSV